MGWSLLEGSGPEIGAVLEFRQLQIPLVAGLQGTVLELRTKS